MLNVGQLTATLDMDWTGYRRSIDEAKAYVQANQQYLDITATLHAQQQGGGLSASDAAAMRSAQENIAAGAVAQANGFKAAGDAARAAKQPVEDLTAAYTALTQQQADAAGKMGAFAQQLLAQGVSGQEAAQTLRDYGASAAEARNTIAGLEAAARQLTQAQQEQKALAGQPMLGPEAATPIALGAAGGNVTGSNAEIAASAGQAAQQEQQLSLALSNVGPPAAMVINFASQMVNQLALIGPTASQAEEGFAGLGAGMNTAAQIGNSYIDAEYTVLQDLPLLTAGMNDAAEAAAAQQGPFQQAADSEEQYDAGSIPIPGHLFLIVYAIQQLGSAALTQAADLQQAQIQIQAYGNTTAEVTDQINSGMGLQVNSTNQLTQALGPYAGVIANLNGGILSAADATEVLTSAQTYAQATGTKVSDAVAAEAEIMKAYQLPASDAAQISNVLYNAAVNNAQGATQAAQAYDLFHEELGVLNPSLADASQLIDTINRMGADTSRTVSALASGFDAMTSGTKTENAALQANHILITDANNQLLPYNVILGELVNTLGKNGDAADVAAAKQLGFGSDSQTVVGILHALYEQEQGQNIPSVKSFTQEQLAAQQQTHALGGELDQLRTIGGDALAAIGKTAADVFGGIVVLVGGVIGTVGMLIQVFGTAVQQFGQMESSIANGIANLPPGLRNAPIIGGALQGIQGVGVSAGEFQSGGAAIVAAGQAWTARGYGAAANIPFYNPFGNQSGTINGLTGVGINSILGVPNTGLAYEPPYNGPGQVGNPYPPVPPGAGYGPALSSGAGRQPTEAEIAQQQAMARLNPDQQANAQQIINFVQQWGTSQFATPAQIKQLTEAELLTALGESGLQNGQVNPQSGAAGNFQFVPGDGQWNQAVAMGLDPTSLPGQLQALAAGGYMGQALAAIQARGPGLTTDAAAYAAQEGVPVSMVMGESNLQPNYAEAAGLAGLPASGSSLNSYYSQGDTAAEQYANDLTNLTALQQKLNDTQTTGATLVTAAMVNSDGQIVTSAWATAEQKMNAAQAASDKVNADIQAGNYVQVDADQKAADAAIKAANDSYDAWHTADQHQTTDLNQLLQQQLAAAQAVHQTQQDLVAGNQQLLKSFQDLGLQIPETWKNGLAAGSGRVQDIEAGIVGLDRQMQQPMSPDALKALQSQRDLEQGNLTDANANYSALSDAAKQYDSGITALQKAQFDSAKAYRDADLTEVRAKNQQELSSTLDRINQEQAAQQAQLTSTIQVSGIERQSYLEQAAASTDSITRQKDLLQASLASQTAAVAQAQASQLAAIRDSEAEQLTSWTALQLTYQEKAQQSAAYLEQIQVDLDAAKAEKDIALAQLQMQLQEDLQNGVQISTDTQAQAYERYITTFIPGYISGLLNLQNQWTVTSGSIGISLANIGTGIQGVTDRANDAAQSVQTAGQSSLALVQAQASTASTGLDLSGNDPRLQSLQRQVDQETLLKDEQDQQNLGLQQQLTLMQAQASVLSDQLNLMRDEYAASAQVLGLQQQLDSLSAQQAQTQLNLLNSVSAPQAAALDAAKEQLAVLQSQNAVLSAQVTLAEDSGKTTATYLSLQTTLAQMAVTQDQTKLSIAEQVNAQLAGEIAATQAVANNLKLQTDELTAQLNLTEAQEKASPQYQQLQVQVNQLQVAQAALSVAGQKNDSLDREVTMLENQQKLLDAQTTLQNTGLQTQIAQQTVTQDQTALTQANLSAQQQQNPTLAGQLATLEAQQAVLAAQQALLNDQNSEQTLGLTQAQAIAKVQEDQQSLLVAQNSVISQQTAQLQIELDALDRQSTQLQDQQKVMQAQETLAESGLTAQQAIQKVQGDQLSLQQAQVTAQQAMLGGVNATLQSLQQQLQIEQQIHTLAQSVAPTTPGALTAGTPPLSAQTPPSGSSAPYWYNQATGVWENYYGQTLTPQQIAAQMQGGSPVPTASSPIPTANLPAGQITGSGTLPGGYGVTQITVNVGGKTITEQVLQNLATGQVLEVSVP